MTHFNHEWDMTKTPAVPMSVGDRYYAQDLNDDFNYLKHLPYEVFLQGRSRGVMVTPSDTWDNDTNSLTLSGGFGVILQDNIESDPDEDFTIPPKIHSSPRYERIPFVDITLAIPTDNTLHYIVATPTKRSLLQRAKALFSEQYASRVRYDGVITVQDTAPTAGQILVGLCSSKEYCFLIDIDPNQCKNNNVILKKWYGQNKITEEFLPALQTYYGIIAVQSVSTNITINEVIDVGIQNTHGGRYKNCHIEIDQITSTGKGIFANYFEDCSITIYSDSGEGITGGIFKNCSVSIEYVNGGSTHRGIKYGTFTNCSITIDMIDGNSNGIMDGIFKNCSISIGTINSGAGVFGGTFTNCSITIDIIESTGIKNGTFTNCSITIDIINGTGILNHSTTLLFLTHVVCNAITDLSATGGKLNVLNNTVLHTS